MSKAQAHLNEIRHELSIALGSIETGFKHLSSGTAMNPDKAKTVHQNGVKKLWGLLARINEMDDSTPQSTTEEGA